MHPQFAQLIRASYQQLFLLCLLAPFTLTAATSSPKWRDVDRQWEQDIERRMAVSAPVGVRKMSEDPGEKFYPEYWQFNTRDETPAVQLDLPLTTRKTELIARQYENASLELDFLPPLLQHRDSADSPYGFSLRNFLPRNVLEKRGYQCPTGTNSCSSIGYSNVCCGSNETCMKIQDTGLGPVGCCPDGQSCTGAVSPCDTSEGYTACPNSSGGGCCIPGYKCDSVGCIASGTSTVTTTATAVTVVATSSTSASPSVVTTTVINTILPPAGQSTVYETIITPTATTTIGQISINDVSTATTVVDSTLTNVSPPVRPTSNSVEICPTGYYACSAVYQGGCCRNERDCNTTTCPLPATTALITSDSVVTIIVATGLGETTVSAGPPPTTVTDGTTSVTTTSSSASVVTVLSVDGGTGNCATGWYSCAASFGGGCCPSGYGCGSYCSATQHGFPGKVNKVPPLANSASSANVDRLGKWLVAFAVTTFAGMLLL